MLHKRLLPGLLILVGMLLALPPIILAQNSPTFPVPPGRIVIGDDAGLYTILADGSEKTPLVQSNDPNCWLRDGTFSPDGTRLLYTRICGGSSPTDWHATNRTASVFVYDLESQSSSELVANDGSYQDYAGGWHPDGETVVIYSNRGEDRYNLYSVNVANGETAALTDFDSDAGRATYDPTGRYLLYNRYMITGEAVQWEVHVLDMQGQTEVTVGPGLTPTWSPDGQWIAYATEGETADIFIMPATCVFEKTPCSMPDEAHNVTYSPDVSEREPLWSPDQTQIAYLRDTDADATTETWDVFRQDLRTGQLQNLTATAGVKERHSAWERVEDVDLAAVDSVLPVIVRVRSDTANLREEPNTNSAVQGQMRFGDLLFVQGLNEARDWYRVTLPADGKTAWIRGDLVEVLEGDPQNLPSLAATEPAS